uniref:Uncharacterized protein n=1 Tax=Schistosoma japonicum TaxID=6182 RepID=Q5C0B6_SCHJA|nr:unknown [Schistosoma japonicum]
MSMVLHRHQELSCSKILTKIVLIILEKHWKT